MRAKVLGFSEVSGQKFSYYLDNVISVQYIVGTIVITYMKDGKVYTNEYNDNNVKIVIDN